MPSDCSFRSGSIEEAFVCGIKLQWLSENLFLKLVNSLQFSATESYYPLFFLPQLLVSSCPYGSSCGIPLWERNHYVMKHLFLSKTEVGHMCDEQNMKNPTFLFPFMAMVEKSPCFFLMYNFTKFYPHFSSIHYLNIYNMCKST